MQTDYVWNSRQRLGMRSIFRCKSLQIEEWHAEGDAMGASREHAGPLERACPDVDGRQHPFHNAMISGKLSYRYRCFLLTIVSQYKKREEVHRADAYQFALTSAASAPQLRVDRLGRNWSLS